MSKQFAIYALLCLSFFHFTSAFASCPKPGKGGVVTVRFPAGQFHCDDEAAARAAAAADDRDGETPYRLELRRACGELATPTWFYLIRPQGIRVASRNPEEGSRWVYAMCEIKPEAESELTPKYFITLNPSF